MGRIKIEVMSWLASYCGHDQPGNLILEENVTTGETIRSVMRRVSVNRRSLAECVFENDTSIFHDYVSVVVNDRLIPQLSAPGEKLRDGDVIRLFPTVEGG